MPIPFRLGLLAAFAAALSIAPAVAAAQPIPFDQIAAALNGVHQFSQVASGGKMSQPWTFVPSLVQVMLRARPVSRRTWAFAVPEHV
jgi:hypothetical protein